MATKAKVEEVKAKATAAVETAKEAVVEAATSEATKAKVEKAKTTATKAKTTATKKATAAKKTATEAVKKAKKEVVKNAVVQYQGLEFSMDECLKKAEAGFKKEFKGKTLEKINIYVKPEERKIYYVVNEECVGSVDL